MSVWFSASAVVPQLTSEWGLSGAQQSWLTMSVQVGFVTGALLSAILNLADRLPGPMPPFPCWMPDRASPWDSVS